MLKFYKQNKSRQKIQKGVIKNFYMYGNNFKELKIACYDYAS